MLIVALSYHLKVFPCTY